MKVLSLFSGVGGFDLGLERAGMETVFQCEWDKHAVKILEKHWPHVPRWDDVSTLTGEHILRHAPVIDVVAWGSPCQDLSVAGKRAGLEGARSGLFHQGVRIIKELRELTNGKYPRISIWENVAGALSSGKGADFGQVLTEMDEARACFSEWRILDAQYFGIPQRRRRVFLVSVFDPATAARCPDPLLPVSESMRRDTQESTATRQEPASETRGSLASGREVANTIPAELYHKSTVVNQDVNNGHLIVDDYNKVVGTLAASDWKFPQQQQVNEGKIVLTYTKGKRAQTSTDDETWDENRPAPTLNQFDQGDTRATTIIAFASNQRAEVRDLEDRAVALSAEPGTNQQTYVAFGIQGNVIGRQDHNGPAGKGHTDEGDPMFTLNTTDRHAVAQSEPTVFQPGTMTRLGGGVWEGTVPTLRAEVKRGDNEPHIMTEPTMSVRRLTPLECERLMGWPDDWTAGQADTHRYKQCGNGVASPVAQWIGEQILNIAQ